MAELAIARGRRIRRGERTLTEFIVAESALLALEPEWRDLESGMVQVPFVSFDWVIPWWRHFGKTGPFIKDQLCVFTVRSMDGALVGIAPLMVTNSPGRGPIRYRQLRLFGTDSNVTELRTIAAARENVGMIYDQLLSQLDRCPWKWNAINLTGVPAADTALESHIDRAFQTKHWAADTVNSILELKPSWEEFKAGLPRNIKESIRKCYNAPKRDSLSFEFRVVSEPADAEQAVHDFFALHRARSLMSASVMHENYFSTTERQRFLLDVCERFAQRGALRIFQLLDKDTNIATRIAFALGDSLYLYYSGYAPRYAKYSVSTTVLTEATKYAISNGFRTVNLSCGSDVSKRRWRPTEVSYRNVDLLGRSKVDVLTHRFYRSIVSGLQRTGAHAMVSRALSRGKR